MPLLTSLFNPSSPSQNAFFIIGGLGIFLIGINLMGDYLKKLAGNKLKLLIQKTTNTLFKGIIAGAVITVLIQSSSATTVIVVSLVAAKLMTLRQSIGVIMGANIGTTITAFLIGLNVETYSLLFVGIGALLLLFFNRQNLKNVGGVVTGFGFLFLGLQLMSASLGQLMEQPFFSNMMLNLSHNRFLATFVGTILTALIQSSSASIGILQQLYSTPGTIALSGALGILIGANIGTAITVVIASIGAPKEAKQATLAHILFKIFGAILFLSLFRPFVSLFQIIEVKFLANNPKMVLAFAHMFFNIVTTILLFFLSNQFIKIIERIIPTEDDPLTLVVDKLNKELLGRSPVLALEAARLVIVEMGKATLEMFLVSQKYFNDSTNGFVEEAMEYEDRINYYDKIIHDYLIRLETQHLRPSNRLYQAIYLDAIRDFERIGDHCINIVEFIRDRHEEDFSISPHVKDDFNNLFDKVALQISNTIECFDLKSVTKAHEIIELEYEINTIERDFRKSQFALISEGQMTQDDIHYVDILSNLERISDHCFNIAQNIIDPFYMQRPEKATK